MERYVVMQDKFPVAAFDTLEEVTAYIGRRFAGALANRGTTEPYSVVRVTCPQAN